jgi:hypothetical protein
VAFGISVRGTGIPVPELDLYSAWYRVVRTSAFLLIPYTGLTRCQTVRHLKKNQFTKVKRHTYIARDAMGYTPHVNTVGVVKGCTLHVQNVGGGKRYTLHVLAAAGSRLY